MNDKIIEWDYLTCRDAPEWFLPKDSTKIVWKSRKEAQEEIKKSHPILHSIMKRHEKLAKPTTA